MQPRGQPRVRVRVTDAQRGTGQVEVLRGVDLLDLLGDRPCREDLDGEAHLFEHRLDRHRLRACRRVGPVHQLDGPVEAVGPGLLHQFPGPLDVGAERLDALRVPLRGLREQPLRRHGRTLEHPLGHHLRPQGQRQRTTHPAVGPGPSLPLVDGDRVAHRQGGEEAGGTGVQLLPHVARFPQVGHVDRPGLQCVAFRLRSGQPGEPHPVEVWPAEPVVLVGRQDQFLTGSVVLERERSRPDRFELRAVARGRCGDHPRALREHGREPGPRPGQLEHDRGLPGGRHRVDGALQQRRVRAARGEVVLDAAHHRLGVERGAVAELDVVRELDRPLSTFVRALQRFGQPRHVLARVLVVAHEYVVDGRERGTAGRPVRDGLRGVETGGFGVGGEGECAAGGRLTRFRLLSHHPVGNAPGAGVRIPTVVSGTGAAGASGEHERAPHRRRADPGSEPGS